MNNPVNLLTLASSVFLVTALFSSWCWILEKRIQDLSNKQEEYWLRHMENHPKEAKRND